MSCSRIKQVRGRKLRDVTTRVVWRMSQKLDLPVIGLFPDCSTGGANQNRHSILSPPGDEMAFADDLLEQAYHPAFREPKSPRQARLQQSRVDGILRAIPCY